MTTETAPATPREEFAQASQQLAQAQARLDADRRHFNAPAYGWC